MEKKLRASETGIRVEILDGTNEAVGVDKLVDDFLHDKVDDALRDLHEPHRESEAAAE
ncbi:hypothetical protein [Leucobacter sp. gxy201]|uniref:hypothetical protein n=1 Tax=Leucobacter sp. gxy201 TaxID=2957200 RepID=UPI003DA0E66C